MNNEECRYCESVLEEIENEGLQCNKCSKYVHFTCLERGGTPGSLYSDVFFDFTCKFCSSTGSESFTRQRVTWFQAITLVLYNLNKKSSGLARKGFFHWKIHLASFIDKNWDIIFKQEFRKTKRWMGTIPGMLSTYNPLFFTSGTSLVNEQGWWTLTYPNLTPFVTSTLQIEFLNMKQKLKEDGCIINETEIVQTILENKNYKPEHVICSLASTKILEEDNYVPDVKVECPKQNKSHKPAKHLLPSLESICEKPAKKFKESCKDRDSFMNSYLSDVSSSSQNGEIMERKKNLGNDQKLKYLDPFCHYNTSLQNLSINPGLTLKEKLLGNVREELILSPYSNVYLKPYIRRDVSSTTNWLQLMAEIMTKVNEKNEHWTLPPRYPIDYTYVQPEHIPAINSLCSQFFWPGIDCKLCRSHLKKFIVNDHVLVTECLEYPDFSCVVLYRKLIVAFAFLVPDVKFHESYLSFIFTRPGWRNVGIAKFMIYHLIQTNMGKDITLHVSINNPALFLYQKFGFKVENVELDFYDKYVRKNTGESKHAFFCRLER